MTNYDIVAFNADMTVISAQTLYFPAKIANLRILSMQINVAENVGAAPVTLTFTLTRKARAQAYGGPNEIANPPTVPATGITLGTLTIPALTAAGTSYNIAALPGLWTLDSNGDIQPNTSAALIGLANVVIQNGDRFGFSVNAGLHINVWFNCEVGL